MRSNMKAVWNKGPITKSNLSWDGTGKHPVLGLTREEIVALNQEITAVHADDFADSSEKIRPDLEQANNQAIHDAQAKTQLWIENMAYQLSEMSKRP